MSLKSKFSSSKSRSHQLKVQNLNQVQVQVQLLGIISVYAVARTLLLSICYTEEAIYPPQYSQHTVVGRHRIMFIDILAQTGGSESQTESWVHYCFEIR